MCQSTAGILTTGFLFTFHGVTALNGCAKAKTSRGLCHTVPFPIKGSDLLQAK